MALYEVWTEGYVVSGNDSDAQRLTHKGKQTLWEGGDFPSACKKALSELKWDMSYYNEKNNTYYACRLFNNESDARKSFG